MDSILDLKQQYLITYRYKEIERLIYDTVVRFCNAKGIPVSKDPLSTFHEILSTATEIFVEAHNDYDKRKGALTTYFRQIIWFRLTDRARKMAERQHRKWSKEHQCWMTTSREVHDIDLEQCEDKNENWLVDFMEGLSDDACTVVRLCCESPPEIRKALKKVPKQKRDNPDQIRYTVWDYLISDLDWNPSRAFRCFSEIREALK